MNVSDLLICASQIRGTDFLGVRWQGLQLHRRSDSLIDIFEHWKTIQHSMNEHWNKSDQLRHAGQVFWPRMIGARTEYLRLRADLRIQGFDGSVESLSAEDIINGWIKAGWVVLSPNRVEIRVTQTGEEQLDKWKEEDTLWNEGTETMPLKKRLVAGEPAKNLRKIQSVIGNSTVMGIHDPYTTADSLVTLLKLADLGTRLSPALRILGTPKPLSKSTDKITMVGLLKDINTERKAAWELRAYTEATTSPHRRFLVLDDGSVVTCGMSLNHINKNEVLDREPAGSENAVHDQQFFREKWKIGTVVA